MSNSESEARLKTTGRNDPCHCGSGKKYKKCHLAEDQGTRNATLKALEEEAIAKAKASQDSDDEADTKVVAESTRAKKRQRKEPRSKGRGSDGTPGDIPRRGAV